MDIRLYQNPLAPHGDKDGQNNLVRNRDGQDAFVVVSGADVSLFRVAVPAVTDDKLQALLPAILSDYVAGPTDRLHYALLPKMDGLDPSDTDQRLVMVCDQAIMVQAQLKCQHAGLRMAAVWPDYMGVSIPQDGINIYQDGDKTLCRFADGRGMTVANHLLDAVCSDMPQHQVASDDLSDFPSGPGLAVGEYGPQMPVIGLLRIFKWPCMALIGAMIFWSVYIAIATSQYHKNAASYDAASTALFKEAFPTVRRIVNIEAQIRNQLRGRQKGADNYFLSLSSDLFQAVAATPAVRLSAVSYTDAGQGLSVTVLARGYSALEAMKDKLQQRGLRVEDQGSRQEGSLVVGNLIVTRAPGQYSQTDQSQKERHNHG